MGERPLHRSVAALFFRQPVLEIFVGWAKARLRRAHHLTHGALWWARFALPTLRFPNAILHFNAEALVSAARRPFDVHDRSRQSERSARARRTIQCLAVRTGEADCRAAEKEPEGRGAVRDRLRAIGPAP